MSSGGLDWGHYVPFAAALMLAAAATPVWTKVAGRLGIVDLPREDRWHRRPTAKMGGVAMFAATVIVLWLFRARGTFDLPIVSGATLMFALGFVDDFVQLRPRVKFLAQAAIAALVVGLGLRFHVFGHAALDLPFTIAWILGISNAFNLIDNMDGLSAGASSISAGAFFGIGLVTNNPELLFYSAVGAGVTLGFLLYNINPARVFMGDCGSLFLGFMAAAMGVVASISLPEKGLPSMAVVLLILALPIFDTVFVIVERRLHGRPISQGGKDHTSHRLVALGLTERAAVFLLHALGAVSAGVGVRSAFKGDLPEGALLLLGLLFLAMAARLGRINVYEGSKDASL